MSDKELDDLFREAADGFKIKEDPSAWQNMSARLDEGDRAPSFWNWKTITGFIIVGLTGVSVWWYSTTNSNPETDFQNQIIVNTQDVKKVDDKTKYSANSMNEIKHPSNLSETTKGEGSTQSQKERGRSGINKNGAKENIETGTSQTQVSVTELTHELKSNTQMTEKSEEGSSVRNGYLSDEENDSGHVLPGQMTQSFNGSTELSKVTLSNNGSESRTLANIPGDSLQKDTALVVAKVQMPLVKDSLLAPKSEKNIREVHKVSIMLSVSPDFSSIKYFTPDKSGINYGIQIGYNFNNRWSIFTGAISSRKIYTSTEVEEAYTSPRGYDYPIIKLMGDCRVLDIPLNVYYTLRPGHSISFRAGLGISSYIMLSEDYTYYVDNPYGSGIYSQRIDNENNEWFKMANVSLTIQKRLRDRFYIEFEPFLKTPLGGIGEGDVSLVSMGAFLNLRYDIF